MHSKNDNVQVMTNDGLEEVIEELFEWLLSGYETGLETQMRGSRFIFDYFNLMY